MSTRTGDDTATIGEHRGVSSAVFGGHGARPQAQGPWQAARPTRNGSVGGTAGLRPEGLRQPTGGVASYLGTRALVPSPDSRLQTRRSTSGSIAREPKPLERLFEQISGVLAERLQGVVTEKLAPFAEGVVCIDESTLDAMSRRLPPLREIPQGDSRLLPGKLAGVFDVRSQQWRTVMFQPDPHQNEKVLARELVEDLPAGTLVVADLGYFGFAWFDWLTDRGCHWLSRLRAKTSYKVIHTFYHRGDVFDGIVWLGAHRADRAKHAVRLVTFRQGNTLRRYITNVQEPLTFPIASMAEVYARRWDIEMALKLIKQHLKLRLLWSSKHVVIHQQIWATLIISQVLQSLRLEIAHKAGVDPFEVSIGLLVEYAPQYGYEGRDPVKVFVERGRELGFIRPSRRTRIHAPEHTCRGSPACAHPDWRSFAPLDMPTASVPDPLQTSRK